MARKITRHIGNQPSRNTTRTSYAPRQHSQVGYNQKKTTRIINGKHNPRNTNAYQFNKKKNNQGVIIGTIVGAGAILLLLIIIVLSGGKNKQMPRDNYSDGTSSSNPANTSDTNVGIPDYTIKETPTNTNQYEEDEDDGFFDEKDPDHENPYKTRPKRN